LIVPKGPSNYADPPVSEGIAERFLFYTPKNPGGQVSCGTFVESVHASARDQVTGNETSVKRRNPAKSWIGSLSRIRSHWKRVRRSCWRVQGGDSHEGVSAF